MYCIRVRRDKKSWSSEVIAETSFLHRHSRKKNNACQSDEKGCPETASMALGIGVFKRDACRQVYYCRFMMILAGHIVYIDFWLGRSGKRSVYGQFAQYIQIPIHALLSRISVLYESSPNKWCSTCVAHPRRSSET